MPEQQAPPSSSSSYRPQVSLIPLTYVVVLLAILLSALYFIGSVVVESFQSNTGLAASRSRLKTHEDHRGKPVGGAAMHASRKKHALEEVRTSSLKRDVAKKHVVKQEQPELIPKKISGTTINYNLQPDLFTDTIASCISDVNCRIVYHHVGKTGGTTIENTFFGLYPPHMKSCCGSKLMARLAENIELRKRYCTAKFSSYQIMGGYVEGLVKSCMLTNENEAKERNSGKKLNNMPRTVVLSSFREPIQRCLSSIHQMCNKNLDGRTNETLLACRACRYDVGTAVWDKVINMTLDHYEGVRVVSKLRMDNVQVASIDMLDITPFFNQLREKLKPDGIDVPETVWRNPEKKTVCSFSMPSEMMKALSPAQAVYRNMTSGV